MRVMVVRPEGDHGRISRNRSAKPVELAVLVADDATVGAMRAVEVDAIGGSVSVGVGSGEDLIFAINSWTFLTPKPGCTTRMLGALTASVIGEKSAATFGTQIRSYVLQPYQLVKDLRTGVTSTAPGDVLDGDLDRFMAAALSQRVTGEKIEVEDVSVRSLVRFPGLSLTASADGLPTTAGDRLERHRGLDLALGPAEVRGHDDACTLVDQRGDGGDARPDPPVVAGAPRQTNRANSSAAPSFTPTVTQIA